MGLLADNWAACQSAQLSTDPCLPEPSTRVIVTILVDSHASTSSELQNFLVEHGDNADEGEFQADAMGRGGTRLIDEDDDAGESEEKRDGDKRNRPREIEQDAEKDTE